MKLVLLQSTPAHGGAGKANRALLEELAARGHSCAVLAPAAAIDVARTGTQLVEELRRRGIEPDCISGDAVVHRQGGVEVHSLLGATERSGLLSRVGRLAPDWLLVSEEDPALSMLELALEAASPRVVFVSHTPLMLPFGPECFLPNPAKAALLRRVSGVLTPSHYLRDYFRRWGEIEAEAVRFPVYGRGPFPHFSSFDAGFLTLVNPCQVKGISVFLELARELPGLPFAAVPTWGTNRADRAALEALPNVRLLAPVENIDDLFAQTRILLAPSLWGEAFGQIVTEAMLRGIPVVASDAGGLPEALLGVAPAIPVRRIERYERRFDDRMLPVPVVPPQDVAPWRAAVVRLTGDRRHYEELSAGSRRAALAFVAGLDAASAVEDFLRRLAPAGAEAAPASGTLEDRLPHLSPDKRTLLTGWLRRRGEG